MIKNSMTQYITQWCHLKSWPPPIITSRKFWKSKTFLWYHLKIWIGPNITMRSAHENKTIFIHSLENSRCPCNHDLKFSQKYPRFNEVTWKFELPLLSRADIFAKMRQFCWTDLMNCSYYPGLIFLLKKTVLMMSLEILKWRYCHVLTFLQN